MIKAVDSVYLNGVSESLFKVDFCLPAGPYVTDEDVKYIVIVSRKRFLDVRGEVLASSQASLAYRNPETSSPVTFAPAL